MDCQIVAICVICNGPIYHGEPALLYGDGGLAHRFSTWCSHYRAQDEKFQKEVGIDAK